MVSIIHGSSHFKPLGQTAITGPTGATGTTGATGPDGVGITGNRGYSGADVTNMYLVNDDKLYTEFTFLDGSKSGFTTDTRIKGPTGATYNLIDVGNTYDIAGETFGKGRNATSDLDSIVIKTLEADGVTTILTQDDSIDTVNIHYDRGDFGYVNIESGNKRELIATDPSTTGLLVGVLGTTFDTGTSLGMEDGAYALDVRVKSYKEKIKYLVVGEDITDQGDGQTFYKTPPDKPINPNLAKLFVLDMRQINGVGEGESRGPVQLRFEDAVFGYTGNGPITSTGLSKAFTLIVKGAANGYANVRFDGSNVIWPLDSEPCWSGETDIFNFFWLPCESRDLDGDGIVDSCVDGAAWHGNIIQYHSQGNTDDVFACNGSGYTNYDKNFRDYPFIDGMTGTTGACCIGDNICVHTTENSCNGYYHGAGSTCGGATGSTSGICYDTYGACCITNKQTHDVNCYDEMSVNDCVDIGNLLNNTSAFGGTGSLCEDMKCSGISKEIGACCDGIGNCEQLIRSVCVNQGHYFQGVGISCYSQRYGFDVCRGGTGACDQGYGVCVDGVSGAGCINDNYLYMGDGSLCVDNSDTTAGCVTEVAGLNLQPGDLYAGGMVVGLYRPYGSSLFGNKWFGGSKYTKWQNLILGSAGATLDSFGLTCDSYQSKYDYHGYGFDSDGCPKYNNMSPSQEMIARPDAYYVIVSMHPLGITGDREVVNPKEIYGATSEFYWGNRGSAWGPLYNQKIGKYDDITSDYKSKIFRLSEGYWYDQNAGSSSLGNVAINTFPSCRKARRLGDGYIQKLETKSPQTAHGLWHRNWGMYNTIRIISADNALYKNYNDSNGDYSSVDFGPGLTGSYISAVRATRLFDDGLISATGATGSNTNNISSWYLPSQDEMSFLASNCIGMYDFDLNVNLIEEGGEPIHGWHWTSSGGFNETKGFTGGIGEGIINPVGATGPAGVTADPGTVAWAMKFDQNGIANNFRVAKKDRTQNTYQVRPIRLVRCDGKFAEGSEDNYKLWKLPNVLRDEDKGINQRY